MKENEIITETKPLPVWIVTFLWIALLLSTILPVVLYDTNKKVEAVKENLFGCSLKGKEQSFSNADEQILTLGWSNKESDISCIIVSVKKDIHNVTDLSIHYALIGTEISNEH